LRIGNRRCPCMHLLFRVVSQVDGMDGLEKKTGDRGRIAPIVISDQHSGLLDYYRWFYQMKPPGRVLTDDSEAGCTPQLTCSQAWYELRTSGPASTWRNPRASASRLRSANSAGGT
jgi:hypothetical protein